MGRPQSDVPYRWMRLDHSSRSHPKDRYLSTELKISVMEAFGIRTHLYCYLHEHHPLGAFESQRELDAWISEMGPICSRNFARKNQKSGLIAALFSAKVLEMAAPNRPPFYVKNWAKEQGALVEKAIKDRERHRILPKGLDEPEEFLHGGIAEEQAIPPRTNPRTLPNQTLPESIYPPPTPPLLEDQPPASMQAAGEEERKPHVRMVLEMTDEELEAHDAAIALQQERARQAAEAEARRLHRQEPDNPQRTSFQLTRPDGTVDEDECWRVVQSVRFKHGLSLEQTRPREFREVVTRIITEEGESGFMRCVHGYIGDMGLAVSSTGWPTAALMRETVWRQRARRKRVA